VSDSGGLVLNKSPGLLRESQYFSQRRLFRRQDVQLNPELQSSVTSTHTWEKILQPVSHIKTSTLNVYQGERRKEEGRKEKRKGRGKRTEARKTNRWYEKINKPQHFFM
jgi:hypothetical protein